MPRETRRNTRRKADERAAEKTEETAASQPMQPNTKFGQASEVITRYFGFQGVPRRFTKPSSDNGSTSSLQSCPASSEDEYEDEEGVVDISFEPPLQRQESTESSSLTIERRTTTLEPSHEDAHAPPASRKRRKMDSPSTSQSRHYSPPPGLQEQNNENDNMEMNSQPSSPRLLLSIGPINRPSTDFQRHTQSSAMARIKSSTRSLSPHPSRSPRAHISPLAQLSHSMPHDQTTSSPPPGPELFRSSLLRRADTPTPSINIAESLAGVPPDALTLSSNQTPRSEHQISAQNRPASCDSSPSPSKFDSSALEPVDLIKLPPVLQSPNLSLPGSSDLPMLPTTEACFEPQTSPVCGSEIQARGPSQAVTSSEQPEAIPVEHSDSSVSVTVSRVRHGVAKRQTLLANSKEERTALVALYMQEAGELKTIKAALYYLSNSRLTRGVRETERLLRILGQAEEDGEVTLRPLHRKRVKEIKERDAQFGNQVENHRGSSKNRDQSLPDVDVESNVRGRASAVEIQAEDNNASIDVPMMDAGEEPDMGPGANLQRHGAAKMQAAEGEERIEDIIYVHGELRPSQLPLTRVKGAVGRHLKNKKAENTSGRWAFHSCVRCRVGLLDEINEERTEEGLVE